MGVALKVRKNFQITLPASIRKKLGFKEGDFVEAKVEKHGILLKPKKIIDAEQAWFWTKEWQEGEKEAQEDIKRGRVKKFDSAEKLLKELKK